MLRGKLSRLYVPGGRGVCQRWDPVRGQLHGDQPLLSDARLRYEESPEGEQRDQLQEEAVGPRPQ